MADLILAASVLMAGILICLSVFLERKIREQQKANQKMREMIAELNALFEKQTIQRNQINQKLDELLKNE